MVFLNDFGRTRLVSNTIAVWSRPDGEGLAGTALGLWPHIASLQALMANAAGGFISLPQNGTTAPTGALLAFIDGGFVTLPPNGLVDGGFITLPPNG